MRLHGHRVNAGALRSDDRAGPGPRRGTVITALGITQILAWGSSYYLPAVLAQPIAAETGWPLSFVVGGLSAGLLAAGLVSPRVGRSIERRGGRPVLIAGTLLLAAGLLGLGLAHNPAVYLGAWIVMGLGMAASLYDPAFATLGRLYGSDARRAITTLTLFGGFASTLCWPLSAFLASELGWRGACFAYAAVQLTVALPIYLYALPREGVRPHPRAEPAPGVPPGAGPVARRPALVGLLMASLTISAVISATMSVHMLSVLQARGIALASALALGALVGPAQVGARFVEMFVARYHHPVWTKAASVAFAAAGLVILWSQAPIIPLALMLYGAGIGLESIARGTLPLALFGAGGYAALMGRLALPSLIAQAAAPSIGALLLEAFGAGAMLSALVAIAIVNVGLVTLLVRALRR